MQTAKFLRVLKETYPVLYYKTYDPDTYDPPTTYNANWWPELTVFLKDEMGWDYPYHAGFRCYIDILDYLEEHELELSLVFL